MGAGVGVLEVAVPPPGGIAVPLEGPVPPVGGATPPPDPRLVAHRLSCERRHLPGLDRQGGVEGRGPRRGFSPRLARYRSMPVPTRSRTNRSPWSSSS